MTPVLLALIAAIPPTLLAVATLIAAIRNNSKLNAVHIDLNSRLSELIKASVAQGRQDERDDPKT